MSVCHAAESPPLPRTAYDRAALDRELSQSVSELRQQGPEAVRSYVERLTDLFASLDATESLPAAERRALGARILGRLGEIGLLARDDRGRATRSVAARGSRAAGFGSADVVDRALAFLSEGSVFAVVLLGGLIVAFSLGRLGGYRRGASEASYYGAGDPRQWFVGRGQVGGRPTAHVVRITLDQVRATLADGRTVLLQLGYDVAPRRRDAYLLLVEEMQRVMNSLKGPVHTAWEDPRHPNRFYEVVVCRRLEDLDVLTSEHGALADLDAKIEACWLPGRPVLRRAWWGVLPERNTGAHSVVGLASSTARPEVHAS